MSCWMRTLIEMEIKREVKLKLRWRNMNLVYISWGGVVGLRDGDIPVVGWDTRRHADEEMAQCP